MRRITTDSLDGRVVTRIDNKHSIEGEKIIKTSNGVPMPDDEPRMLFRGRDRLALPMLLYYRDLCVKDGCNDYQLGNLDVMIKEFSDFFHNSPTMKQPGITRGV